MKTINLTQGKVALVDDQDYDYLMQWKWFAIKTNHTYYAARKIRKNVNPKRGNLQMHRAILQLMDPKIQGDHKDHNGLNNQRNNLRVCSHKQNQLNKRPSAKSGFKGVYWWKNRSKWFAKISINRKWVWLGFHKTREEAAKAYDKAAVFYFGEFAYQNFK